MESIEEYNEMVKNRDLVRRLCNLLKCTPDLLLTRVNDLLEDIEETPSLIKEMNDIKG